MTNPTTYFGWQMPTATDLVTDLPADFEVFGQAVDTDFQDLLGGTTGQILSKTSATDLAFTWINNDQGDITAVTAGTGISGGGTSGAVTITNDMATTITTNGDLIYGTGSGTYTRRAIGSTGNVLTVSGGIPVWSAPAGGGKVLQVVQATTSTQTAVSTTTYTDTTITASITPTLNTSKILVLANVQFYLDFNGSGKSVRTQLLRNATIIFGDSTTLGFSSGITAIGASAVGQSNRLPMLYLDSPATTSSTTYKIQGAGSTASGTLQFQDISTPSSIILMEIGA